MERSSDSDGSESCKLTSLAEFSKFIASMSQPNINKVYDVDVIGQNMLFSSSLINTTTNHIIFSGKYFSSFAPVGISSLISLVVRRANLVLLKGKPSISCIRFLRV
jgi:hypothetical protein